MLHSYGLVISTNLLEYYMYMSISEILTEAFFTLALNVFAHYSLLNTTAINMGDAREQGYSPCLKVAVLVNLLGFLDPFSLIHYLGAFSFSFLFF